MLLQRTVCGGVLSFFCWLFASLFLSRVYKSPSLEHSWNVSSFRASSFRSALVRRCRAWKLRTDVYTRDSAFIDIGMLFLVSIEELNVFVSWLNLSLSQSVQWFDWLCMTSDGPKFIAFHLLTKFLNECARMNSSWTKMEKYLYRYFGNFSTSPSYLRKSPNTSRKSTGLPSHIAF